MLISSGIIHILFGAMYGIGCSNATNDLYLYGQWNFVGESFLRKGLSSFLKLMIEAVVFVLPGGLLIIVEYYLIESSYASYFVYLLGMWLGAFFVTAFSNWLLVRLKVI